MRKPKNMGLQFVIVILGIAVVAAVSNAQAPNYLAQWGAFGSGPGQFNQPHGIAVDANGFVYVADYGNHRIQKFTSSGGFVTQWGSEGIGGGIVIGPTSVAAGSGGKVYVVDDATHHILVFGDDGTFLAEWSGWFRDVAADDLGNVYASDNFNLRLRLFDSVGNLLASRELSRANNSSPPAPWGVAVPPNGGPIFVADYANQKVNGFSDMWSNSPVDYFTIYGNSEFDWLAYDGVNSILYSVVSFPGCGSFMRWNRSGGEVGGWVSCGTGDGQVMRPRGLAVARNGNLYVVDSGNNRVQVFGSGALTATRKSSWGRVKAHHR